MPRDHISLYADDDDKFNSHSEDHQDLAPEAETHNVSEIHSNVSSEDMRFQNFIKEVFKLLPADKFPKKTDEVLGGNRPSSSIEMEMLKAPKKSISLPQSKCPLIRFLIVSNSPWGLWGWMVPILCPHNCSGLVAFKG